MFIDNDQSEKVLSDKRIRGVKFTGSTRGGKQVAATLLMSCHEIGEIWDFSRCPLETAISAILPTGKLCGIRAPLALASIGLGSVFAALP